MKKEIDMANRMGPCFHAQAVGLIPSGKDHSKVEKVETRVAVGDQCLYVERKTTPKKNTHKPCLCFNHVRAVYADTDEPRDEIEDDFTPFEQDVLAHYQLQG